MGFLFPKNFLVQNSVIIIFFIYLTQILESIDMV
jgi:hypothetical protein